MPDWRGGTFRPANESLRLGRAASVPSRVMLIFLENYMRAHPLCIADLQSALSVLRERRIRRRQEAVAEKGNGDCPRALRWCARPAGASLARAVARTPARAC